MTALAGQRMMLAGGGHAATEDQTPLELKDHQLKGLEWLTATARSGRAGALLADEMGLGKTAQALGLLAYLWRRFEAENNAAAAVSSSAPAPAPYSDDSSATETEEDFRRSSLGVPRVGTREGADDPFGVHAPSSADFSGGPSSHLRFLVVAPLSVTNHWVDDAHKFVPNMRARILSGPREERQELAEALPGDLSWDILVVSYETALADIALLRRIRWRAVVIDEAHRLKSPSSKQREALESLWTRRKNPPFRLLLTGTPVQNNMSEYWAILSLLDTDSLQYFGTLESFLERFGSISTAQSKAETELHVLTQDFVLRRTKADAGLKLPRSAEVLVYTSLSPMQQSLYRRILEKNVSSLEVSAQKTALTNTLMALRKCCGHPYTFDGMEAVNDDGEFELGEHLVSNCGKLVVLDQMLVELERKGRKVLIFSQFTHILDILQDYLTLRSFDYERLDGSARADERFASVERFQHGGEAAPFCFLLSTRAGGVGLTLTSADTVIFYDSDWNPQQDLQAAARAHRIGQDANVAIIRLISKGTCEEIMLRRAWDKLRLTQHALQRTSSEIREEAQQSDLGKLLRFGLRDMLKDLDEEEREEVPLNLPSDDIEAILNPFSSSAGGSHHVVVRDEEDAASGPTSPMHHYKEFEGVDYTDAEAQRDAEATARFIAHAAHREIQDDTMPGDKRVARHVLTEEELVARREAAKRRKTAVAEQKEAARLKKVQRLADLARKLNFVSLQLPLQPDAGQEQRLKLRSSEDGDEVDHYHAVTGRS
jgi:chromodomain-helicase-DNA-binding protein 1-like